MKKKNSVVEIEVSGITVYASTGEQRYILHAPVAAMAGEVVEVRFKIAVKKEASDENKE